MIQRSPSTRVLPILFAFVLSACTGAGSPSPSGAAPSPVVSPSAIASSSTESSVMPSQEPSASIAPSGSVPGTTAACPSGGTPASGERLATTDPEVSVALPDGWQVLPLEDYRSLVEEAIGVIDDERVRGSLEWQLELIDAGVIRGAAAGRSEPSGFSASIGMKVIEATADLQATMDRDLREELEINTFTEQIGVIQTDLPVGPAYCVGFTTAYGTPSLTAQYYVIVGDKVVVLSGTAPQTDAGFPALVRSVALSMISG